MNIANNQLILTLLVLTACTSFILKAAFGIAWSLYFGVFIGILLFIRRVVVFHIPNIFIFYIIFTILSTLFLVINNGFSSGKMFAPIILSSIGIALTIFETLKIKYKMHLYYSFILMWGIIIYLIVFYFIYGNLNDALRGSRNHISSNLILIASYYYIVRHYNNIKVTIFLPIMIFYLSILAVGSSGIIVSFIFLLGVLLTKNKKILGVLLVILFLVSYAYIDFNILFNSIDIELLQKFSLERLIGGDIRFYIINQYISSLDFIKIIIGSPLYTLSWWYEGEGTLTNPHNSYLLLHAKSGILSLFIVILIITTLIKLFKYDFVVFSLFLALILRSFSDVIAFSHGYYEWSIMLIYLYTFYSKPINKVVANE